MAKIPGEIDLDLNRNLASEKLSEVSKLVLILKKIILDNDFKNILSRLEHCTDKIISSESLNLEKIFNHLRKFLSELENRVNSLVRIVIDKDLEAWSRMSTQISMAISMEFTHDYENLRNEFNVILLRGKELIKFGINKFNYEGDISKLYNYF